ncbi:putative hemolysin-III channel protein Izh2 [Xylariaceae sp. FL0255]|nr:putative hemolysin-III channel protein Izh2 [Xylariaceae sp. FL0255]
MASRRRSTKSHNSATKTEYCSHQNISKELPNPAWFERTRLLYYREIPDWQQDNRYILSGYRPTTASAWISFKSLSFINNQTINAYSHMVGALIFIALPFHFYQNEYLGKAHAHANDFYCIALYCLCVTLCFMLSALYHIMLNHSPSFLMFFAKMDYLGVLLLMWGAAIPTINYGFLCHSRLKLFYWSMTTCTALCCGILSLSPTFSTRKFRIWRASMFAAFGLSAIIFIIHGLLLYGWEVQSTRMSLVWMGWMATFNLVGVTMHVVMIPERWVPYRFDLYGSSHQIFHTAVLIAACIHYGGLVAAFQELRSDGKPEAYCS